MPVNVPPPPSVTQTLGYWRSHHSVVSQLAVFLYGSARVPSYRRVPWPPWMRTSSTSDCSPARHSSATARLLTSPVARPMPDTMPAPPRALSSSAFGVSTPWNSGEPFGSTSCVRPGCRPTITVSGFMRIVSLTM